MTQMTILQRLDATSRIGSGVAENNSKLTKRLLRLRLLNVLLGSKD